MKILGLLLLLPLTSMAAPKAGPCPGLAWQGQKELSDEALHRAFDASKRDTLEANYLHELTRAQPKPFLRGLAVYLMQTEPRPDWRAFYELLRYSAELDQEGGKSKKLERKEICEIYAKVKKGVKN